MPDALPARSCTIAYLTAGGAGMFCGSCMHDNTLAAAMQRLGCEVLLVPLYTPIRTDEANVSIDQVFFGGINVYLQQRLGLFRWLPRWMDRWLDHPWLLRRVATGRVKIEPPVVGDLTVSMLQGEHGHQRKEIARLVDWLANDVRPALINLSNILIAGSVPAIKRRLGVPVLITLQGDDLFLSELTEPYKTKAFQEIRRLGEQIDGYIVPSQYYAEFMSGLLGQPREKIHVVRLGLETTDFLIARTASPRPPTIGYLARLAPEKGLHVLVDAFIDLARRPGMEQTRLRVAGWLSRIDAKFFAAQRRKIEAAGLAARFDYLGSLERQEKLDFLASLDVLSVPTVYHEPKGLFVLEALASGVPVVQPQHGSFPELLAATGGGVLVEPQKPAALAAALHELLTDHERRRALGNAGRAAVLRDFSALRMAEQTLDVYRKFLPA